MGPTSDSTQAFMPAKEPASLAKESGAERAAQGYLNISPEEVAFRAYQHWEKSGGQHGDDQAHWYAAEHELRHGGNLPGPEDNFDDT